MTEANLSAKAIPITETTNKRVDVVIPVYNEERDLGPSVTKLREFLQANCRYQWRIMVADNASKDGTLQIAQELSQRYSGEVTYIHLDAKGRGRALKAAWQASDADVVSYMDVDLSTNLRHFMPMIEPLMKGEYHVATGSRLMPGARVKRQFKREIVSRIYNLIVLAMFPTRRFYDAQCGFKAVSRRIVQELIPHIMDNAWFFDSELLLRSEQNGYRIWEVPVEWIEDMDTRVKIVSTAIEDLKGLWRVRTTKLK